MINRSFPLLYNICKFGLGRASYDMTQEKEMEKLQEEVDIGKKYDSEFPKKYFEDFQNILVLMKKSLNQQWIALGLHIFGLKIKVIIGYLRKVCKIVGVISNLEM